MFTSVIILSCIHFTVFSMFQCDVTLTVTFSHVSVWCYIDGYFFPCFSVMLHWRLLFLMCQCNVTLTVTFSHVSVWCYDDDGYDMMWVNNDPSAPPQPPQGPQRCGPPSMERHIQQTIDRLTCIKQVLTLPFPLNMLKIWVPFHF